MTHIIILLASLFLVGCATINMLPESAEVADFDTPEGKTGWSE